MNKITPFLIAFFMLIVSNFMQSQVVINEILSSNTSINQDEDGTYQDWVELRNNGATSVNLTGYGLTDDPLLPYKWIFPNVSIAAGQYLLIWCSDKNRVNPANPLHTNFKISANGDVMVLTNASNVTLNSVPATALNQNISYGRLPNGTGSFVFFSAVTPNAANGSIGFNDILPSPTFSQDSAFRTTNFSLTLSTSVVGATILYTLDGSEPKATNLGGTTYTYKNQYPEDVGQATGPLLTNSYRTFQYSVPLAIADRTLLPNKLANISTTYDFVPEYIPTTNIFKGTVVKAKVIKAGSLDSKTVTKSYYISPQGITRFSFPVISFSIDEDKFFGYENGINVAGKDFDDWRIAHPNDDAHGVEDNGIANYYRRGAQYEKVANMTYFVNGVSVLNQEVGLRIRGATSRDFQNKSLNIFARADYGDSSLSYPFFGSAYNSFPSLVLHNSGNDFNQTLFRDPFCHALIKSLNIVTKKYQPSAVFLNGEYWGILNLRDKVDADYFNRVFNIPTSEIDIIENEGAIVDGDAVNYNAMYNYIASNSLATQTNFDYIKTKLDPENFKDYFISNIYLENTDWPGNNIFCWRKKTTAYEPNAPFGHDGRWRWFAHDMDDTFAISSENINYDTLAAATDPIGQPFPNPAWSTLILRKMLENPGFKNEFITRFADLMNTTFLTSRMLTKMAEMKAVIAPEMPQQFTRWEAPFDNGDWNYFLNLQTDFINQRTAFQRNHIRTKFGIANNINATLNVSNVAHGFVKINTINIKTGTDGISASPYPWTGVYFSNIPITLKAIANPGYVFSHWTGASTSTNPEIIITSATNITATAVFVVETVGTSQPIYYWLMDGTIADNVPLETLNTTYKTGAVNGTIQYQSCLVGYPFTSTNINWRKASMERRNSPTDVNYIPEANNSVLFSNSDMKGLQIKEPLENGSLKNAVVLNFSTANKKDIKVKFAAINELTNASAITIDYSINAGTPVWITTGLTTSSIPLTAAYQLFSFDFTSITSANNNANFKVRIRFTGTNMTADTGARITFNNIAVYGTSITLSIEENEAFKFSVFPNPFSDIVTIEGANETQKVSYTLFSMDGKLIHSGIIVNNQINFNDLSKGIYMLQLSSDDKIETKKIVKR